MKHINISRLCVCLIWITAFLFLTGNSAWAAEKGANNWRPTYDTVMSWVNFGILAFLLIKYLRTPIANFLYGEQEKVAREIRQLEQQKDEVSGKIRDVMKSLDDSEAHFAELKSRIVKRGEIEKQHIIEDAEQQSGLMMEMAKQKVAGRILQAKSELKVRLVDEAIAIAERKLPRVITDNDNEILLDRYLAAAA
jgi:F-type H+-transporting ATPase subunit b